MARRPRRPRPAPRPQATLPATSEATATPSPAEPAFLNRTRLTLMVGLLLAIHGALAVRSLVLENPTVDEVIHLPAGISYWQRGTFRLYHHNPPLVKLVAALPVLAYGVNTAPLYQKSYWRNEPPNKAAFAHEFAFFNSKDYFELFTRARLWMPLFSIVGGLVVFAWSSRLYGGPAGLLSLALWVFCPNVLAHARLVTTDMGATALGALATYLFWRNLERPTWKQAVLAGLVLGLAQLTKFSLILLYGLWPILGLAHLLGTRDRVARDRRFAVGCAQGLVMLATSVLVIDIGYAFEGVGLPLGRHEFVSRSLTRPTPQGMIRPRFDDWLHDKLIQARVNRFRGTFLESLPVPLPEHYLLGFDDQKMEAEGVPEKVFNPDLVGPAGDEIKGYPVYLDGVVSQKSWWYYYLFTLAYKVPEGTMFLVVLSLIVLTISRRTRASWFDELMLLTIPFVVLVVISLFTNINLGLRYVLPIFPYLFISTGKLVPWAAGMTSRVGRILAVGSIVMGLGATMLATIAVAPHYLSYFNEVSGGPSRGSDHLIDSNLDWGQDLLNLRRWLSEHAVGERVGLAYFGQIHPSIFADREGEAFEWFLPPPLPGTIRRDDPLPSRDLFGPRPTRLEPGLYAVSATLVRGLPWRVYDNARASPYSAWVDAFSYFHLLEPIERIGNSIFLYRVDEADATRLSPLWEDTRRGLADL